MRKTNLWTLLMALVMLFSMAACGEKGDDVTNEAEGPKPPTTVDDNDWQTVASSGGTIEKDSISITFPSGTFSGDTKVAISNVSKGKICGNNEASPFYQITMPITTKRATTIKIKSQKLDDDVSFVFNSVGFSRSAGQYVEGKTYLETSYSNGEYIATLPVFDNEDEENTDYFAIGLAHVPSFETTTRGSSAPAAEGTVKGIKWKLYIGTGATDVANWENVLHAGEVAKMKDYITNAITKITDLGFTISDKDRVIPYYYVSDPIRWGAFTQDKWADSRSWIGISVEKLLEAKDNNDVFSIPCTLIHETFHYFQADYDPRAAFRKGGGLYGTGYYFDNENILYEMGAIWIEQFINNGQLNAKYLLEEVFFDAIHKGTATKGTGDKLGFGLEISRWGNGQDTGNNRKDCNAMQGYTMGPWLYYMTTQMSDYGFSKSSVLELHELWRKNWKSDTHNAYYILNDWVKLPNHNAAYIFDSSNIDDYYLMLLQGKLVKDFSIGEFLKRQQNNYEINEVGKGYELEGQCYAFGCGVRKILLKGFKDVSLEEKELVVKQESPNVHTYMAITQKKTNHATYNMLQRSGEVSVIAIGDSMLVKGSVLEQLRESDGSIDTHIYLITTNTYNNMFDWDINPFKVSIELRDVKKEQVANIKPYRANLYLAVKYFEEVTRDGNTTTSETYNEELSFGFANINGYDKEITTTVDGTTLKVSCVNEERGMKETLSYDILNFNDNKKMKVANLVYTLHSEGEHYVSGDGNVDVVRDYTIKIYGQLSFTRSNPGGGMQEYDFGLSETINSTNIYFEDKRINKRKWSEEVTSTVEWKLVPNTTFNAYLSFEFYP